MVSRQEELNKLLKPFLKSIYEQKVSMDHNDAQKNVRIMNEVCDGLVTAMRSVDPLFDELYRESIYTGSYYENLRVKSANEFDINMALKIPFNSRDVKIELCKSNPVYVTYQLRDTPGKLLQGHQKLRPPFDKILKHDFFDQEGFLQQDKVARWMQSVFSKAIDTGTFQKPVEVETIKRSRGGPAFTFYITTSWRDKIDVDLVPVINAAPYPLPPGMTPGHRFQSLPAICKGKWFLVPKPFKPQDMSSYNELLATRYWRMSFPEAEKQLLHNTGCLTMIIKLFKLLRDRNEYWRNPIASYYIKTFFLLEYEKYEPEYWAEFNLGSVYLEMLRKLQAAIEARYIPYYFNREGNLLADMKYDTAHNIACRIQHILRSIERTPSDIVKCYNIIPNVPTTANNDTSDASDDYDYDDDYDDDDEPAVTDDAQRNGSHSIGFLGGVVIFSICALLALRRQ